MRGQRRKQAYHCDDQPEAHHNQGGAAFVEPLMESFASALTGAAGQVASEALHGAGKTLKKMFDTGLPDDDDDERRR